MSADEIKTTMLNSAFSRNEYLLMPIDKIDSEFSTAMQRFTTCSMPYEKDFYDMKTKLCGALVVRTRSAQFWFAVSVTSWIAFIIYLNFL